MAAHSVRHGNCPALRANLQSVARPVQLHLTPSTFSSTGHTLRPQTGEKHEHRHHNTPDIHRSGSIADRCDQRIHAVVVQQRCARSHPGPKQPGPHRRDAGHGHCCWTPVLIPWTHFCCSSAGASSFCWAGLWPYWPWSHGPSSGCCPFHCDWSESEWAPSWHWSSRSCFCRQEFWDTARSDSAWPGRLAA